MTTRLLTVSVDDDAADLIRRIESAKVIHDAPADGFDPNGQGLPLGLDEAREVVNSDGFASVVVEVPLNVFSRAVVVDSNAEHEGIYDVLHELAFGDLGVSMDSTCEVLGLSRGALIVRYTTLLRPFLPERSETAV